MIGRVLIVVAAGALVYACARDQAKNDFQREAALEHRVYVLEQHVRALEGQKPKAPSERNADAGQQPSAE